MKGMILTLVQSYVNKNETIICVVSKADEAVNVKGLEVTRDCDPQRSDPYKFCQKLIPSIVRRIECEPWLRISTTYRATATS